MRARGHVQRRNIQQRTRKEGKKGGEGTEISKDRQPEKQVWEFERCSSSVRRTKTNQNDSKRAGEAGGRRVPEEGGTHMFRSGRERLKEEAASFYLTAEPQPFLLGGEEVTC